MIEIVKKELSGVINKIDNNMKLYINKTPCISSTMRYSENLSSDGDWTGSFWTGMVIMAGLITDDKKYQAYLDGYFDFYNNRLQKGYKDHDMGFLYQLYALDAYRLTNDCKYADMAIKAAEVLMYRYTSRGGYIRAWGRLLSPDLRGKIIIDCLLNLPLLFCVAQMTGNEYMKTAAVNHATATLNNIREDGSAFHTFNFDYIAGKPLKGENEGGFSDNSCWSRGQSWGVYGFYLAYLHTGNAEFLEASEKLADYFTNNLDESYIPKWDFKLTADAPGQEAIDTSAAAITASALYDLSAAVSISKSKFYREIADKILMTLIKKHSQTFNESSEALLDKCYCGGFVNGERVVNQWASIFGDYFYMEALIKHSGTAINMWDV